MEDVDKMGQKSAFWKVVWWRVDYRAFRPGFDASTLRLLRSGEHSRYPDGQLAALGTDTSALSTAGNHNVQPERIREEEFGAKREINKEHAVGCIDIDRVDSQNVRVTQADGTVAAAGNDRTLGAGRRWRFCERLHLR